MIVSNNAWSVYNFRLDVIRWLRSVNSHVIVVSPQDDFSSRLEQEGCEIIPLEFNNKGENPVSDIMLYRRLRKLYKSIHPDFIFHFVAKPNIYGSMAAAAMRIPSVAVITGLGYPFARKDILFYIMRFLYRIALKKTREVWFLNNEDAKIFVDEEMADISRVRVLPGEGINTQYFLPVPNTVTDETFHFLMCTRLLKSKGVGIYADAAKILRNKRHNNVQCHLVGFFETNHPDSITREELANWQKEQLITWHGFAEDVRPYLSAAQCLVFPSYYNEGIPRCLLEAGSMQVPAITSMNKGCREVVIDGVNGFISRMQDPFDLAEKMEKMLRLPADERMQMGRRGREMVIEKFEVSKIIQVYANTLISAFENKHGSNS